MSERDLAAAQQRVVTGKSARMAAALFNYGNILAIAVPPLGMLWLGASMLVYAMNRHHPEPKVGQYTQRAAYRFYGIVGLFVVVAAFIPGGNLNYYLIAWGLAAALIIPWSAWDLAKIYRDDWRDVRLAAESEEHE